MMPFDKDQFESIQYSDGCRVEVRGVAQEQKDEDRTIEEKVSSAARIKGRLFCRQRCHNIRT